MPALFIRSEQSILIKLLNSGIQLIAFPPGFLIQPALTPSTVVNYEFPAWSGTAVNVSSHSLSTGLLA